MEHPVRVAEEAGVPLEGGDDDLGLKPFHAGDEPAEAVLVEFGGRIVQQQGRQQTVLALEVLELAEAERHGGELLLAAGEHIPRGFAAGAQGDVGAMRADRRGAPLPVAGG